MKALSLSKVYQLIEQGPVVLLTTALQGKLNVMTMSWHMMVDFEPPLLAFVMSDRNYSFQAFYKTRECVLAIPTVDMIEKVVAIGNCSGSAVDKFARFRLLEEKAAMVQAPLLPECYANLECRVVDSSLEDKYGLCIVQVMKAWINSTLQYPKFIHHAGMGRFIIDGEVRKMASKKK